MAVKKMLAGDYDFGQGKLLGVGDATTDTGVPSWGQVKTLVTSAVSNLDYKGSVRVASTGNVSISAAPATLDGVTLAAGNRLLLKDQTAAAENGLYVFASTGQPLTRATDADAGAEVTPGLWVTVEEGTTNADTAWWITTDGPITVGTTAITFSAFPLTSGGDGRGSYDAVGPATAGNTWAVNHGLATKKIVVQVWDVATDEEVDVKKVATNNDTVTISAGVTLAQNGYRVVVFARTA
jgi:phage-related tail fiber protein